MTAQTMAPVSATRIIATHTRAQLLDFVRTPIAIISLLVFPSMTYLFFVLPQGNLTKDPLLSLSVIAQLGTFGVMSAFLFSYGIGVAEDRANPWSSYVRTLPAGPMPPTMARFFVAALGAVVSLIPLVAIAALTSAAADAYTSGQLPWWRAIAGLAVVVLAGAPFLGMGLAIGYSMTSKAAVAVAQILNFPLAFIGGLFIPPQLFPDWLNTISLYTPSRAAREVVAGTFTGTETPAQSLPVLLGWTMLMFALAMAANRRDEGRRFR